MNILGVDYGTKRVGLAISIQGAPPEPLPVLPNDKDFWTTLEKVTASCAAEAIVVGLPRNLEGEDTAQTKLVRGFVDELKDHFNKTVVLQDEADTTNLAKDRLKHQKLTAKEMESRLDSEAAVIILEDYLREQ